MIEVGQQYRFHQVEGMGMYIPGLEGNCEGAIVTVIRNCNGIEWLVRFPNGKCAVVYTDELLPISSMFSSCRIPYQPEFYEGETVQCIDGSDSAGLLDAGRHYIVQVIFPNHALQVAYWRKDINEQETVKGRWHPSRFRKV